MSLNFGFSLPALLPHGGGGFDPFNQSGPTLDLVFAGTASEMLSGGYTLDTNFIVPQYEVAAQYSVWVNGVGMAPKTFSDIVTFTRASSATLFDSTGTLVFAPMNAIRNNTMVGAVAGTPGTAPTGWFISTAAGITRELVGTGTENGITYIDYRFSGTATGSSDTQLVAGNLTPAVSGQTWTFSNYAKIVAGSLTNVTVTQLNNEYDSAGNFLAASTQNITPTTAALGTQRFSLTRTFNNASTQNAGAALRVTSAGAIDITLRIGMPQLERGSTATAVNATSGTAYQGPRFDYNPSTLAARGLLIEEQRVNSIRNNTMQGAVAGTPGTLPTNWGASTSLTGLTREIVGTGTENGVTYVDIKLSGTPSASGRYDFYFETSTGVAALNGQTWTSSMYYKLQAGSLTGVSALRLYFEEKNSGGGYLTEQNITITNPTSAALSTQRASGTRTLNQATTAFLLPGFNLLLTGVAIDITLRIGLPQLEQGAFATSVIPTTTTATTRSADVASVNTLSPWYNAAEGTFYAENQILWNPAGTTFPGVFSANNGSGTNQILSYYLNTNRQTLYVRVGGTVVVDTGPTATANSIFKFAGAYKENDFAATTNGAAVSTDTTGALPPAADRLLLGSQALGFAILNGYLRRITYYPRRMPNAQLQTITT